ncbi:MAG: LamG domain-containing protein [Acidobacteriota bacterium]|nr:LamG domain-containing protein [Acidobacteriota bacterium]
MISPRTVMRAVAAMITAAGLLAVAPVPQPSGNEALRQALTFHASFDGGVDAVRAAGDPALYTAPSFKQRGERIRGLPPGGEVVLERAAGRFGDALRFTKQKSPLVFFRGERNMPYQSQDWSGTVSVWLSVDPATDLEPGFCDPVQITSRAWNDGAFFVEFEKRPESIPFRLGVYADLAVWNPGNRRFDDIPPHERPLVPVDQPPFGRGKWTHVAFTFDRFNTSRPDGVARLYLDGEPRGVLSPRQHTFTWDPEASAIALGLGYIGLLDELSTFNRALSDAEVRSLHGLENGVSGLVR